MSLRNNSRSLYNPNILTELTKEREKQVGTAICANFLNLFDVKYYTLYYTHIHKQICTNTNENEVVRDLRK